jgi:hypothetical protein
MVEIKQQIGVSAEFRMALESLRNAEPRPEVEIKEILAPQDLAKHAVAFSCDVKADSAHEKIDLGTGRMVVLWDTEPQESWASRFRVIIFAKSPLETDIGADEFSAGVSWAWLISALENNGAGYAAEAGTSTRVLSTGYGSLSNQKEHSEVELRASWSPTDLELGSHLAAWQNLICMMSGHPLQNENLSRIDKRA